MVDLCRAFASIPQKLVMLTITQLTCDDIKHRKVLANLEKDTRSAVNHLKQDYHEVAKLWPKRRMDGRTDGQTEGKTGR